MPDTAEGTLATDSPSWEDLLDRCEGWINRQYLYLRDASTPMPGAFSNPAMPTPVPPELEARARLLSAAMSELASQATQRKAIAQTELIRLRTMTPKEAAPTAPAAFIDIKA